MPSEYDELEPKATWGELDSPIKDLGSSDLSVLHIVYHPQSAEDAKHSPPKIKNIFTFIWGLILEIVFQRSTVRIFQQYIVRPALNEAPIEANEVRITSLVSQSPECIVFITEIIFSVSSPVCFYNEGIGMNIAWILLYISSLHAQQLVFTTPSYLIPNGHFIVCMMNFDLMRNRTSSAS